MSNYDIYFKPYPVFRTERLTMRMLSYRDTQDIFTCCGDPEVSRFSEWYHHVDITHSKSYIAWILEQHKKKVCTTWAICLNVTGRVIGTCSYTALNVNHKTAEIGYCIARDSWGYGYAGEASESLLKFGFCKLRLKRIQARIMTENIRSERVLQKLSMQYEGVMKNGITCKGYTHDLRLYSITDDIYNRTRVYKY